MDKDLIMQTKNAFDFIQKLYFEISYLIKEIEGNLQGDGFVIGRPSGYGVTMRSSTGLETVNVENWISKSYSVFFCNQDDTKMHQGVTITKINPKLKIMIIHIEMFDKEISSPKITYARIDNIGHNNPKWEKFEYFMSRFAYYGKKIFSNGPDIDYKDSNCSFKGEFHTENLFSINNSEELRKKIIDPMLEMYKKA